MVLTQVIINGLIAGSLYALIAIGFSLVFSLLKFLHFAHGALVVLGSFIAIFGVSYFHFPWWLVILLVLFVCGLLGVLMEVIVYRRVRSHGSSLSLLLASIGLFSLIESVILLIFGSSVRSLDLVVPRSFSLFNAQVTNAQIILFVSAIILLVLVWLFLKFSRFGMGLRAMSDNPMMASSIGLNVSFARTITMLIASLLAGVAGLLMGLVQTINPLMGFSVVLKGFTAAIIGGVGFVPGSIIGGFLLGLFENLGILVVPSEWKDAITVVILIVFLIIRPGGLFSRKVRV